MGYLPNDYEIPAQNSAYLKFSEGTTTFRALSQPITGWEYWTEKDGKRTPIRVHEIDEVPDEVKNSLDNRNRQKHFWMLVVLERESNAVKILEIAQINIIKNIVNYINIDKWGDIREYDLSVTRVGKDKNTKYLVTPLPKEKHSTTVQKMVAENLATIDLEKVFSGESPFLTKE